LQAARVEKKRKTSQSSDNELCISDDLLQRVDEAESDVTVSNPAGKIPLHIYWQELDNETTSDCEKDDELDECEVTDAADEIVEFNGNVFESLLVGSRKAEFFENTCFRYQRGPNPTL
jgi:hypothetical protein